MSPLPKPRTGPQIQARLRAIAAEMRQPLLFPATIEDYARELEQLATEMGRRKSGRPRARPTARRMTAELRNAIRAHAAAHPEMGNRDIGMIFGVDGGRVAEALNGFR